MGTEQWSRQLAFHAPLEGRTVSFSICVKTRSREQGVVAHGLRPAIPTLGTRENEDQEFQATSFDCLKTKNKQKAKRGEDEPLWTLCKASGLNKSKMFVSGFFPNEDQGRLRHKSSAQLGSSKVW